MENTVNKGVSESIEVYNNSDYAIGCTKIQKTRAKRPRIKAKPVYSTRHLKC